MPSHTIFNERPECQDRLIQFLINMGYDYVSRSEAESKRRNLSSVLFEDELIRFLQKQTYTYNGHELLFSGESITKAVKELDASLLQGLSMASKEIYHHLTLGISLEESIAIDSDIPVKQSFDLHYIDFDHPANNIWQVTEEFSVQRPNGSYARPDIVLMVNGIPFVIIECKKSSVDVAEGVQQNVRNMMPDYIPQLFKFAQIVMAINPQKVLYGTGGTGSDYFVEWREDDIEWQNEVCKKCSPDGSILEQDKVAASMLSKHRLLDLVQNFILFDNNIKKIAWHQQYFAINKSMDRINGKDGSTSKGGVIWHTQGSGKSLTMVMLVKKIQAEKGWENPRFIIVTDRVNLDKQIRDNFANSQMAPVRAATGKGLNALLKNKENIVITTLINKFETVYRNKYLEPDSDKFYVLVDEAHRSQYKAMFNYMKEVLPNATLIAFTGTPLIAKAKKNTYKTFGEPIHNYTMRQAIADGITVPLVYEGRKVKQEEPSLTINDYFDSLTEDLPRELKDKLSDKFSRFKAISEARSRINLIGFDIADHFKSYCIPKGLKAMVVCSSRAAAVEMYEVLKDVSGINPRVVITFGDKREGDGNEATDDAIKKIKAYHQKMVKPLFGDNDEKYDDHVCGDFKNPEGEINILIVKDKLLTGFDAPVAGVLYLDKSIQQHSLLQAIARVNRVYKGKDFGLIVDYWGVFGKLNKAIDMYEDAESGMNGFDKADIDGAIFGPVDEKNKLAEAYANLIAMFDAVKDSSSSDDWQKSLADEKRRKEFYNRLKEFANLLNLALSNRDIFVEVGFELIEKYRKEYLFYRKLKDSVMMRYDDEVDLSKYEQGIKNLIDTFVNATDITTVVKPVSIGDEKAMKKLLEHMDSNESRADAIKTRIESKLKQIRYDDPLLFEEFSSKIKKTIDLYNETRDADAYLESMKIMADDFRNGITSQDYPSQIASDSDSKAFYGAILTQLKKNAAIQITSDTEELIAQYSFKIKEVISDNAKRDWKHNEVVHKAMHRSLDDCLFDMFEEMGVVIDKSNIDMLDLIIDETMKVAVARY